MKLSYIFILFIIFSCKKGKEDLSYSKGEVYAVKHKHFGAGNYISHYFINSHCENMKKFVYKKVGSGGPGGAYYKKKDSVCFFYNKLSKPNEQGYIFVSNAEVFYSVNSRDRHVFYKSNKSKKCNCVRAVRKK